MIDDDEIAERIAKHIRSRHGDRADCQPWIVGYLDEAECHRLAYIDDVRERAKARREAGRIRRLVFAKLGVADRAAVEK